MNQKLLLIIFSFLFLASEGYSIKTTVEMLQEIQRIDSMHFTARTLASEITNCVVKNWEFEDINRTNRIEFWWHENGYGTNSIQVHVCANPKNRPNGPWPIKLKYDSFWKPDAEECRRIFLRGGFVCKSENAINAQVDTTRGMSFVHPTLPHTPDWPRVILSHL